LVKLERIGEGAAAYNDPTGQETHRGLRATKISDNANVEEAAEPDVKYIGNMHGNEPLSMQMCMGFIDDLLTRYATDSGVQDLVNNSQCWVSQSMHPDGPAAGTRTNANGYDLNRSFPDLADGPWGDVTPGTATMSLSELEASLPKDSNGNVLVPEVKAVMDWSGQHHFELAANFHTGNLVVNYPYDDAPGVASGQYAASPDDALYRQLAKNYVDGNSYMAKRSKFVTDGVRGITNGSAWFRIHGGMQDFDYRYFNTKHVTVELYTGYGFLSSKNVDQQWAYNKPAMFGYLSNGLALLYPTTTAVTSAHVAAAASLIVSGGTVLATAARPSTVDALLP